MSLADYPPELFDLLFPPNLSHLALRLYKCNNRLLNTKLQGITRISLEHVGGVPPKIPGFIAQLHKLHSFRINLWRELAQGHTDWPNVLRKIPSSIESLEMYCSNSYAFIVNDGTLPPSTFPRSELSHQCPPLIDVTGVFPNLTTLKLRKFEVSMLRVLPSTLKHLAIRETQKLPFMSGLPRSLEIFECKINAYCEDAQNEKEVDEFLADLSLGPPNMRLPKQLSVAPPKPKTAPGATPYCWTAKLPEGVENLEVAVSYFSPTLMAGLPRSVTRMNLCFTESWNEFLKLYNDNKNGDATKYSSIWPSSLATLELKVSNIDAETLGALPAHLTSLRLWADGKSDEVRLPTKLLPPHLKTLICQFGRNIDSDLYIEGALPSTLRQLDVHGQYTAIVSKNTPLPTSITRMRIGSFKTLGGAFSPLPSTLTHMETENWAPQWFSLLPRSVTSIEISTLAPSPDEVKTKRLFDGIPEGLRSFSLLNLANHMLELTLDESDIPHWPNIESLKLPWVLKVSSALLRRLPRLMKLLDVQFEVRDESDFEHIPEASQCNLGVEVFGLKDLGKFWPLVAIEALPGDVLNEHAPSLLQRFKELD